MYMKELLIAKNFSVKKKNSHAAISLSLTWDDPQPLFWAKMHSVVHLNLHKCELDRFSK